MPKAIFSDDSLGPVRVPTTIAHRQWIARRRLVMRRERDFVVLGALALIGASMLLSYFIARNLALFAPGYSPTDRVASLVLLLSEVYTTVQGLGYYLSVAQAARIPNVARQTRLARLDMPGIAIYIATYDEPAEIIEATVNAVALLDYPQKQIYLNCDHQSAAQAEQVADIARRYGVTFIHRTPNTGFKAGGINTFIQRLGRDLPAVELLCIFDADSVPTPTFLREVIPYFLDEPRLAFVQAPQFYGNTTASLVAEAAGQQQTTFAHYISEGKQQAQAMFFCGTNVVFRVAALRDIGGLCTTSVTEDFATSLALHRRGWRSQYCNAAYVTGLGPTTLQAYWTQQGRWALGNLQAFLAAIPQIAFRRGFRPAQRWEYFLSGAYYFVGLNTIITLVAPTLYLLANVRPLILSPLVYVVAYLPHVLLANWFFFATMGRRGFRPRVLFLAQCLSFVTFPVYAASAVAALLRRPRAFAVTPTGATADALPWRALLPHLLLGALLAAAILVGIARFLREGDLALVVNVLWCAYHLMLLSTVLLFRLPPLVPLARHRDRRLHRGVQRAGDHIRPGGGKGDRRHLAGVEGDAVLDELAGRSRLLSEGAHAAGDEIMRAAVRIVESDGLACLDGGAGRDELPDAQLNGGAAGSPGRVGAATGAQQQQAEREERDAEFVHGKADPFICPLERDAEPGEDPQRGGPPEAEQHREKQPTRHRQCPAGKAPRPHDPHLAQEDAVKGRAEDRMQEDAR
jgi:cellulose synthase (UDP-forming)